MRKMTAYLLRFVVDMGIWSVIVFLWNTLYRDLKLGGGGYPAS